MAIRYFNTAGAVTAAFPTGAGLDVDTPATTGTYASSGFLSGDSMRLLGIRILTSPAANETVTLKDKAGTTIHVFTAYARVNTATQALDARVPDYGIGGGLEISKGGFSVTTTDASSKYQWVIDIQRAN